MCGVKTQWDMGMGHSWHKWMGHLWHFGLNGWGTVWQSDLLLFGRYAQKKKRTPADSLSSHLGGASDYGCGTGTWNHHCCRRECIWLARLFCRPDYHRKVVCTGQILIIAFVNSVNMQLPFSMWPNMLLIALSVVLRPCWSGTTQQAPLHEITSNLVKI